MSRRGPISLFEQSLGDELEHLVLATGELDRVEGGVVTTTGSGIDAGLTNSAMSDSSMVHRPEATAIEAAESWSAGASRRALRAPRRGTTSSGGCPRRPGPAQGHHEEPDR